MTSTPVKILLVEDNPTDAELLQETLSQIGMGSLHVTCVEYLDAALTRLRQEAFDALLLDLSLPDSSGAETFQRVRRAAPHIPIVILTCVDDEDVGLDAIRHDVQDYLVKGHSDGRQIVRALRYAIERKQMENTLKQLQTELEIRVDERTAELALANEALQQEMTERVRAEAQQLTAVMEERTRIAREIHDTIAQGLTGIVIQLETADYCLDADPRAARLRIHKACELARNSLNEARHSVWALRPHGREDDNLVAAILTLIERQPHEDTVAIDFTQQGIIYPLPSEMGHELLRLCQEGLTNAVKHAQARQIHITLAFTAQQVVLCVADDGQGFDPTHLPAHRGFGLRILEERCPPGRATHPDQSSGAWHAHGSAGPVASRRARRVRS